MQGVCQRSGGHGWKVKTPTINTYEKQMLQCKRKFERITLSFPVEPHQNWSLVVNSNHAQEDNATRISHQIQEVGPYRSNTHGGLPKRSHAVPGKSRRSSLHARSRNQTPESPNCSRMSVNRRLSVPSHHDKTRRTPNIIRRGSHFDQACTTIATHSNAPTPSYDKQIGIQNDKQIKNHIEKHKDNFKYKNGNNYTENNQEGHKYNQTNQPPTNNFTDTKSCNNADKQNDIRVGVSSSSFRQPDMLQSLPNHQDYFIRALTTLAINNLTCSNTNNENRRTSHNFYNRNIQALVESSNDMRDKSNSHLKHPRDMGKQNRETHPVSDNSDSTSEEDSEGEATHSEPDRREKVNRLRNHLKCSGLGEPVLVTVSNAETDESKRSLQRLVRKVHRGLSPERQQRLRLKTHLDYEMSLMKGESFCEQQDQVLMRTASADMGDRDQQLLEEEMKDKLLHDLKNDSQADIFNLDRQNYASRNRIKKPRGNDRQHFLTHSNDSRDKGDDNDYRLLLAERQRCDVRENEGDGDNEEEEEGCDMSGTLRSPISRKEQRRRVLLWVSEVENAMGLEWKENMRVTYGGNNSQRGTGRQNRSSDELENGSADELIGHVMKANAVNKLIETDVDLDLR